MKFTHFDALVLFALVISIAFAFLTKQSARDRLKYALWAFLAFVMVAVVLGWIMYPFPR
jgi:heme A synthase